MICTLDGSDRASDATNNQMSPFTSQIDIYGRSDISEAVISVIIYDKAGNSDNTFSGTPERLALDDTGPSGYSLAMASGIFYNDKTNDMTPDIASLGATDGSGVGMHSVPYYFGWRVNDGVWTYPGWQVSSTFAPSLTIDSDNYDFSVIVRDLLGNEGTAIFDNDNTIEDNPPENLSVPRDSGHTCP